LVMVLLTDTSTIITTIMDITMIMVTTTPILLQTLMQIWISTTSEFGKRPNSSEFCLGLTQY
jgi:hypothetical protein